LQSPWIGIDIGGTDVKLGLVRPDGGVIALSSIPTRKDEGEPEAVRRIAAEARRLLSDKQIDLSAVRGIGIGMPGCIDAAGGVVLSSPNFPASWFNLPLRDDLAVALGGLPAAMDNDARAATLGEGWCGAAKGSRNYLVMTLGTGLGGGAVLDGRPLRGADGFAGEFGHICVHPGGRICGCGRRGCLEAYASATGVVGYYRELGGGNSAVTGGRQLFEAAAGGDAVARKVVDEAARALGLAIGSLLNAFNPEVVVLAGRMSKSFGDLEAGIHKHARAQALREPYERVAIRASPLVEKAGIIGAAALCAAR
jgi:glucokinase